MLVADPMCVHEVLQGFTQRTVTYWATSTLAAQACVCVICGRKQVALRIVLLREAPGRELSLCLNNCRNFISDGNMMTKHSRLVNVTAEKPSTLIPFPL